MKSPEKSCCAADTPRPIPGKKEKSDYRIRQVIQALNILEQFHDEVDELGLTELSRRLAMKEWSVDRLLTTLKARNYIEQNGATKGYRLGFNNLKMAQAVLQQTDLCRVAHPVLAALAVECGETTSIAVLRKSYVTELDAVQSKHPVRVVPLVGLHLPIHCTAAGKMLIARETDQALERLFKLAGLTRYTPNTLTCGDELRRHLHRAAENGYAVDDLEMDPEVRSVAACVLDYAGREVGALVITGPSYRIDLDRLRGELIPLVRRGAREISAKLGFHDATSPASGQQVKELESAARKRSVAGQRAPAGRQRAAERVSVK